MHKNIPPYLEALDAVEVVVTVLGLLAEVEPVHLHAAIVRGDGEGLVREEPRLHDGVVDVVAGERLGLGGGGLGAEVDPEGAGPVAAGQGGGGQEEVAGWKMERNIK